MKSSVSSEKPERGHGACQVSSAGVSQTKEQKTGLQGTEAGTRPRDA